MQTHDDAIYSDAIRKAITHNLAYDRQCECLRGQYHYDIILQTQNPQSYIDWLKYCLRESDEEMSLGQMFDLAPLLVNEDSSVREAMYFVFKAKASSGGYVGAEEIVKLDGFQGFEFVADQLANLDLEEDHWTLIEMIEALEKKIGEADAWQELNRIHSPNNPQISEQILFAKSKIEEYLSRRVDNKTSNNRYVPEVLPIDELNRMIDANEHQLLRSKLRRWSMWCKDEAEIRRAVELIVKERDTGRLIWLLRCFSEKAFPGDLTRIVELSECDNIEVSSLAAAALGNTSSPIVRDQALKFASEKKHPRYVVSMLDMNFQQGDEWIIEELIAGEFNDFELHGIDFAAREFFKSHPQANCDTVMLKLFQKNPCSICRHGELEIVIGAGKKIPNRILQESVWDCNPDTRELARTEIATNATSS